MLMDFLLVSTDESAVNESDQESQAKHAYRMIEGMIVTLALPPGSRVTEKFLSETLGIGRTPVREALQKLAYERTIKILPRSGAIVAEIDITEHFKLIELRREIDRILVSRATRQVDPLAVRMFLDLALRFEAAGKANDGNLFIQADADFNRLIEQTAKHDYAAAAMAPLQAQTRRLWYLYYKEFGDLTTVSRLHAKIARAVASRDEQTARAAADTLLDYVEDYTYRTIRTLENKEGHSGISAHQEK